MESRASRLLRGTLLGSLATLLAAVSHAWAGGHVPDVLSLVLGGVFAAAVGTIAIGSRRRTSLLRTVLGVGIGQLAFHLVFSLLGTSAGVVAGTGHHASAVLAAAPAETLEQGGAAMWIAHAIAGLATVVYLRRLEALVWGLISRAGGFLLRGVEAVPLPVAAARLRIAGTAPVAHGLRAADAIARRGPPAVLPAV